MKPVTRSPRLSPLAGAIALACTGASLLWSQSDALAQEQPEEITVTGTRIQRTSGFSTPVPVTAVTLDEIKSFKPGTTMADQLDQLPQFYSTHSAAAALCSVAPAAAISICGPWAPRVRSFCWTARA